MKPLSLVAVGLAIALSIAAQTTNEEKQEPAKQDTGKATTEGNVKAKPEGAVQQNVQPNKPEPAQASDQQKVNPTVRAGAQVNEQPGVRGNKRESGQVREKGGNVSHSTTVFRKGRETNEHLTLHRSVRERTDVHFSIGTHPRAWWLSTYSIVFLDSCYYYLADDGCWYPAYGFDPGCNYPVGVVYCD